MMKHYSYKDLEKQINNQFLLNYSIVKVCDIDYSFLFLEKEQLKFTKKNFEKILMVAKKHENNEDITFFLGYKYFYNVKLLIKKGVFVPQYDSEKLVDLVGEYTSENSNGLEIGFGTGAISIAIAKNFNRNILALDISKPAYELAIKNNILNQTNVDFLNVDFFSWSLKNKKKFDFIVSNPPYLSIDEKPFLDKWVLENQPFNSLFSKNNGFEFFIFLIENINNLLVKKGVLILELNSTKYETIIEMLNLKKLNYVLEKDLDKFTRYIIIYNE